MKSDNEIRRDVERELEWEPSIDERRIGVSVVDGVVNAAADALKWNVSVPADRVQVKVENGWLTLTGEVPWEYQRRAAERAVRDLPGVRGITNFITVKPRVEPEDIKRKIEDSFKRQAVVDASNITVRPIL